MMFMMTMPPTTSAMDARPSTTQRKERLICFQISRNVSLVSISKSSGVPGRIVAARTHDHAHFVFGALHDLRLAVGAGIDVDRIVIAVDLLVGGDGYGDPVVLRLAEGLALAVADSDDGEGDAVDANFFADRIAVAQQVVDNVVSNNGVVGGVFVVGWGKAAAQRDVDVVERKHGPRVAAHAGIVAGVAVGHHVGVLTADAPTSLQSAHASRMAS